MRITNLIVLAGILAAVVSPSKASSDVESAQACWKPAFEAADADAVAKCYSATRCSGCHDVASWGSFSMVMVAREDGKETPSVGRYTDVSRKIDGRWVYVVDHASDDPAPAAK